MKKTHFLGIFFFGIFSAQDYSVSSIPEELKKNANLVVRNNISDYTIKSIDQIEILENNTVTILNKAGDDFSKIYIPYDKETKVEDIKVNILDENGKTVKTYGKKDFSDYSHTPSFGLYVDDRILVLNPVATKYPYSVQYSYKVTSKNTVFIRDFSPRADFNISVQNAKRTFHNNSGIKLRSKISDTDFGKVQQSTSDTFSEYKYNNLLAINKETYAPSIEFLDPKVEFALEKFNLVNNQGTISNWTDFGKWYYNNLLNPATTISPELKNEVSALGLSGTTEEKVRKLYQFMQQKTRYVFVAMGIGGWKPMNTEEVRVKGYGDCKALTNYMRSLLIAAGIPSYYSIIKSDYSPQKFDPDFPKMGGNHIILMVPTEKGNIWLENTSQTIAFNHLSFNTTNRNVLAVNEKGIEVINTPVYSAEKSKEFIKAFVKIKSNNSMETDAQFHYTGGQYDFNSPLVGMNAKDQTDAITEHLSYLKIQKLETKNFMHNRDDAEISYNVKFTASDYSKRIGSDIFFRVMPFYESNQYSVNDERLLPFETSFAYQDAYEIEFLAPEGYKFTELPTKNEINSEYGSYSIEFKSIDATKISVSRILTINKGIYPKEKFNNYIDFRKKVATLDNTKVLLTPKQ